MAVRQAEFIDRVAGDTARRETPLHVVAGDATRRASVKERTRRRETRARGLSGTADGEHRFRTLIEQAADGIFVTDAEGRIVLANTRMCLLLGYPPDEIVGLDVLETYEPGDREIGRQFLAQLAVGTTFRFERLLRRRDGTSFPIEASVAWLPGGERQTIVRDMTARKRAEDALRMEERRLRALVRLTELESRSLGQALEAAMDEICALVRSPFGYVAAYDEGAGDLTVQAWSRDVLAAVADAPVPFVAARTGLLGEAIRQRKPFVANSFPSPAMVAFVSETAGSERREYGPLSRFMSIPIRSRGRLVGEVGVANKPVEYTDIDVRQLTQMMDVVWRIAERQQAEDDLRRLNEELERRVAERTAEYEAANAELEATNVELEAANGQLQALLREQDSLHAELAYRAMHDPLTGLANRALFGERLEYALEQSRRGVAVLWIDLDHFKQINDIFGHDVGDEVLVAVADRLREIVRTSDDIARMGGDEFAIVLPNVYEPDARFVASRVLEALRNPDALRLQVGASLGVAWQGPGAKDGKSLVKQADLAMYRAKVGGGNAICV